MGGRELPEQSSVYEYIPAEMFRNHIALNEAVVLIDVETLDAAIPKRLLLRRCVDGVPRRVAEKASILIA